jgi:hypothetical protein
MKNAFSVKPLLFLILFHFSGKAQFYNFPNDYSFSLLTERTLAAPDSSIHTSLKPYVHFFSGKYTHVADTHHVFKYISEDMFLDKIFVDHLLHIKSRNKKYRFTVDPLVNFEGGRDGEDTIDRRLYVNTRGFIAAGYLGKDFYFETMLAENQAIFPNYIESHNNKTLIVPGQGRWKTFKKRGYDYAFSSGFFSYQPSKHINIQAGHGKQKIGNGYRSLLLSDNAFNYPFLRVTQQWFKGRLQYTNIYAALMNLVSSSATIPLNTERLFQKKAASFQYLSINPAKWLSVGFFQGMIWQAADKRNVQHLEWQYFNPVIFSNLGFYGLNDENNILIGADLNLKLGKSISLYGQFMADDLSGTRTLGNTIGYQAGIRYFDAFKVKNLFLQVEYNDVAEDSYANPGTSLTSDQSYSHYNQNLAFTPGYGKEFTLVADYKMKRVFFHGRYSYQYATFNNYALYENNIFNLKLGYTVNPSYNAAISVGVNYRNQDFFGFNASASTTSYLYIGFKTNIFNTYFDF